MSMLPASYNIKISLTGIPGSSCGAGYGFEELGTPPSTCGGLRTLGQRTRIRTRAY